MPIRVASWLMVAGWIVVCPAAAQPPKANQPASDPRIDRILQHWQRETAALKSLVIHVTCTRKNNVFNRTEVLRGTAKFLRLPTGDYAARLDLVHSQDPNRFERYIYTGAAIYVYRPSDKQILVYNVPPRTTGRLPDEGPLPFLFGMPVETARRRYTMRVNKVTDWYTYIDVRPNFARDQADFIYARLAILNKATARFPLYAPKQIYWVEPNNIEVTWDVTGMERNESRSVDRREFAKPQLPAGWNWKYQPNTTTSRSNPPPTVIRPQQGKDKQ